MTNCEAQVQEENASAAYKVSAIPLASSVFVLVLKSAARKSGGGSTRYLLEWGFYTMALWTVGPGVSPLSEAMRYTVGCLASPLTKNDSRSSHVSLKETACG